MGSTQPDEKAIFNVARRIDSPEARADYLQQVCGADGRLLDRVTALLRAFEDKQSFLESPPVGPDPAIASVARLRLAEAGWEPGDAVVLAAAGSSDESACGQVHLAARQLESLIGGRVEVGFITTATPTVPEAVERARRTGRRVVIASHLLAPGLFHQRLSTYGADAVAAPLGPDPRIVDLIVTRMRAAISPYRRVPVPRHV